MRPDVRPRDEAETFPDSTMVLGHPESPALYITLNGRDTTIRLKRKHVLQLLRSAAEVLGKE